MTRHNDVGKAISERSPITLLQKQGMSEKVVLMMGSLNKKKKFEYYKKRDLMEAHSGIGDTKDLMR